jgi:hypothetical protein
VRLLRIIFLLLRQKGRCLLAIEKEGVSPDHRQLRISGRKRLEGSEALRAGLTHPERQQYLPTAMGSYPLTCYLALKTSCNFLSMIKSCNFLSMIKLASVRLWIEFHESAA